MCLKVATISEKLTDKVFATDLSPLISSRAVPKSCFDDGDRGVDLDGSTVTVASRLLFFLSISISADRSSSSLRSAAIVSSSLPSSCCSSSIWRSELTASLSFSSAISSSSFLFSLEAVTSRDAV